MISRQVRQKNLLPDVQHVYRDYRDAGRRRSKLLVPPGLQNPVWVGSEGRLGGGICAGYGRSSSQQVHTLFSALLPTLKLCPPVTEIVGVEFRRTVGVIYQMFFTIGILILPLLAYYITDWRWLQVAITVPYLIFLCYYW